MKTIGDAMMLRCDDPELAVRLGLRVVSGLEAVPGFPPVRVGMHTGPAVSRDGDWYGATVNVAARLCAAAGGGEVLVSESTLKAAGRMRKVRVADRRLHWLKNVTEPIPARLASERPCPHRPSFLRPLLPGAARGGVVVSALPPGPTMPAACCRTSAGSRARCRGWSAAAPATGTCSR